MKYILLSLYFIKGWAFFIASFLFYPFELTLSKEDRLKFSRYCLDSAIKDINEMYSKGLITKEYRDELLRVGDE